MIEIESTESQSIKDRQILLKQKNVLIDLKSFLSNDFIKEDTAIKIPIVIVNWTRIRDIGIFLFNRFYHLENICVADEGSIFEINYIYNLRPFQTNSTIIIQTRLDKFIEPTSLKDIFPYAEYLEKDINHRMGIDFSVINSEFEEIIKKQPELCIPFKLQTPVISQNERMYGIFNSIHENHNYFNIQIKKNLLNKIELRDGWLYQKIQPELEKKNPLDEYSSIFLQIAKNHNVHLNLVYLLNLESILDIDISNKVKYIRTLLAEFERISSHLLWFSNLAELCNTKSWVKNIFKHYLALSSKFKQYFQSSNLYNTISFRKTVDISVNTARELYNFFKDNSMELFDLLHRFVYKNSTENRLSDIGFISEKDAIDFGLTGPSVRGSGAQIDIRASDPYLIYSSGELTQIWNLICFNKGDTFARTQVRLWELRESIEICKYILKSLSTYEIKIAKSPKLDKIILNPNKILYSTVESPNGTLSMYLRTDFKEKLEIFHTVRISNNANFAALGQNILKDNDPYDIPLIVHSLDLNFQLIDL